MTRLPNWANLNRFTFIVSKLLASPGVRSVGLAKETTRTVIGLAAEAPLMSRAPVMASVS